MTPDTSYSGNRNKIHLHQPSEQDGVKQKLAVKQMMPQ